jgi:hypothetical protein
MTRSRLEVLRSGAGPLALYAALGLLSFPTMGHLVFGRQGLAYAHDVFDLPRGGIAADWLAFGPSLWDPHVMGGNARLVQQAIPPFALDTVLALASSPFAAYVITTWLLAVVAGFSMHLFLRDVLHLSLTAVVGGAVLYLFAFWHPTYGIGAPALPILLYLADRALADGASRWRFLPAWGLLGGLLLYHGLSQIVLLAAGLQLLYLAWTAPGRRAIPGRIVVWGASWLIALGLYAPVLLTQLAMLPISHRAVWGTMAHGLETVVPTLKPYTAALLPVRLPDSWGFVPEIYGTYFAGVLGLIMLALGVVGRRPDRRSSFVLLLLVAIPVADLVAVQLAPVWEQLGPLASFQFVRVRHLFPFAVAASAAIGLDLVATWLREGRPRLPGRAWWRWAVVAATAVPIAIGLSVAIGQVRRLGADPLHLQAPGVGRWLILLALVGGLILLATVAVALVRARPAGLRSFAGALGVVIVLGLVAERAAYVHGKLFVTRELGTWAAGLSETRGQAFLRDQTDGEPWRVLTFGDHPNRMGAVGLLQVDGYQAIYPLTYHTFFGTLIEPELTADPEISTYFRTWGNRAYAFGPRVDPDLVALAGARWLYVRGDAVPTVPGIVERFRSGQVRIYEVPNVLPRAFLAGQVDVAADAGAVVARLASADAEWLHGTAVVAAGPDTERLRPVADDGEPGPAGAASIVSYAPDRVEIAIRADRPGVLVLTDVMAPGWIAERDGASVPIATVDATFRGVVVAPETRTVVFRYVPTFTYAGVVVAAVTLALVLAWAVAARRRATDLDTPT